MPKKLNTKSQYAPFNDCPELMKQFLTYILSIKNLSVRTVDGYYIELRTFFRFLKLRDSGKDFDKDEFSNIHINDISTDTICSVKLSDVYDFLMFCSNDLENSVSSRSRKISALNSFYKYLSTKTLYMSVNPIENLDRQSLNVLCQSILHLMKATNCLIPPILRIIPEIIAF